MNKRTVFAVGPALAGILVVYIASQNRQSPSPDLPEFPSYQILYLTHAGTQNEFMSPARIQRSVGAELAASWAEVIAAHNRRPLDALIIDASAISDVDPKELRAMYQDGVVLAFFNTYSPTIVELTNDSSIAEDDWMDGTAEPMDGDFYVVVSQLILCSNGDIAQLESGPLCGDGTSAEISSASGSKSADSLNDAAHFDQFLHTLFLDIQAIQERLGEQ